MVLIKAYELVLRSNKILPVEDSRIYSLVFGTVQQVERDFFDACNSIDQTIPLAMNLNHSFCSHLDNLK
jgi:hypothetical protein